MTPASSSTVAMFHRRVGRYRIPMTCYLARRAVRRRSSSTDACGHAAVSVGAPCRPLLFFPVRQELRWTDPQRTGHHRTIIISSPWTAVQLLRAGRLELKWTELIRTGHYRTLLISSPWSVVQPLRAGRQELTPWHAVENRCRHLTEAATAVYISVILPDPSWKRNCVA